MAKLTARLLVRRKWKHAEIIRPGEFVNAPDDPLTYVSTRHVRQPNGLYGGRLIGKGKNAREAWADAAASLRRSDRQA